jgi:GR25 family glycosyltransferase involved in LPS biosynthesis
MWEDITNNGYNISLILEDDVKFKPEFKNELYRVLSNVPEYWDILFLYLHPTVPQSEDIKDIGKIRRVINEPTWGMQGYLISNNGVERLLKLTENVNYMLDQQISKLQGQIHFYRTYRFLIAPEYQGSIIDDMGRHQ